MTDQAGVKGYDGGKKIKDRKRHILIDILGLPVLVHVTTANVGDRAGGPEIMEKIKGKFPRL